MPAFEHAVAPRLPVRRDRRARDRRRRAARLPRRRARSGHRPRRGHREAAVGGRARREGRRTRADPAARGPARDVGPTCASTSIRSTTPRSSRWSRCIEKCDAVDRVCIGVVLRRTGRRAARRSVPRLCTSLGPKGVRQLGSRRVGRSPWAGSASPCAQVPTGTADTDDRDTSASSTPPTGAASQVHVWTIDDADGDGAAARPRRRRDHDRPADGAPRTCSRAATNGSHERGRAVS